MRKLNTAILGTGYIGGSHIDAVRRVSECNLYALADANFELARDKAEAYGIEKCYHSIDEVLADPLVDVIHNCTPNNMHTQINIAALRAGKHLFTEKPLALNMVEAEQLLNVSREHPEIRTAVNFNYRMNPMVQEMRRRISKGEAGEIYCVTGCYFQDWLLYDTDYSWRLEPDIGGPSCCIADIGSHLMDAIQHVTGQHITRVMVDTDTVIPIRKKPLVQTQTFSSSASAEYEEREVRSEEYASVMFRLSGGARGAFTLSQVSAGHGCYLQLEVNGAKQSLKWNQEDNDKLWIGRRGGENSYILRDPASMDAHARAHTSLAKGHPEGWNDAFCENIRSFYRSIIDPDNQCSDFASLEEAAHIIRLTEACIKSAKLQTWIDIGDLAR